MSERVYEQCRWSHATLALALEEVTLTFQGDGDQVVIKLPLHEALRMSRELRQSVSHMEK